MPDKLEEGPLLARRCRRAALRLNYDYTDDREAMAALDAAADELAAKQALIDELVEGLDRFTRVCDDEERREAFNHAVALISKARSSGKAGSDA